MSKTCVFCKVSAETWPCQECRKKLKLSQITDRLFLTNFENAKDYYLLKSKGIRQILVVGNEMIHHTEDFKTQYIFLDDHPDADIAAYFETAHKFIDRNITVVHCQAGISRSPTIVISYLMKKLGLSFREALDFCQKARPIVSPNIGFCHQLKLYENKLKK